jgi:hypothetical protein
MRKRISMRVKIGISSLGIQMMGYTRVSVRVLGRLRNAGN